MNRYVKKPIAIEAVKWKGFNNDEIKDFAGDSVKIEVIREGSFYTPMCLPRSGYPYPQSTQ